jgi:glucose/arabinose dehydrogenase
MHLSSVVGWKNGETPKVAAGLKIEALAADLQHPRSLTTLPNGDVLVSNRKRPRRNRSPGRKTSSCGSSKRG